MPASASTSKLISAFLMISMLPGAALAQMAPNPVADPNAAGSAASSGQSQPGAQPGASGSTPGGANSLGAPQDPEEDDFSTSPYTEYGELSNDEEQEAEDTKFFMYGRLFGLSIGAGAVGATGNRGQAYQPGFPSFELRAHYWFDFNVAIDLGFASMPFSFSPPAGGVTDVTIQNFSVDVKYYLTTTNLPAAIAFANPYFILGFGGYSKREFTFSTGASEAPDTQPGPALGAGLEFALRKRRLYLSFEGKLHLPRFRDTTSPDFQTFGVSDLSGQFYSVVTGLLFVW
ncbi:MAG: outer membrane beta-barrel protein [Bdellovibrionales bacterium]|nr:outer membrane beta-barrel protein [Bdellovibrionales bacterium]